MRAAATQRWWRGGWRPVERKKARKSLRERLTGREAGARRWVCWTERGRWDGMKLKKSKSHNVLLQRTISYVFIVLLRHTGCLCCRQRHCGNEWGAQISTLCMYSGEQHWYTVHAEYTANFRVCTRRQMVYIHVCLGLIILDMEADDCKIVLQYIRCVY